MSLYLVHFLKISKNLEQGNFFGGTLGKFCPIYAKNFAHKQLFKLMNSVNTTDFFSPCKDLQKLFINVSNSILNCKLLVIIIKGTNLFNALS